jgi:hypothetical protein
MTRLDRLAFMALTASALAACGVTDLDNGDPPDVAGVAVSAPSTSVGIGATLQLTASVSPSGANASVTWSSADETRLTVDGNGLVTAAVLPLSSGTVAITATSVENPSISGSVDLSITCGPLASSTVSSGGTLPEDTCYVVEGALSVSSGTLTVEPGVQLSFGPSGSLSIGSDGRLDAEGTMDKRIVFTSADPAGSWPGIRFDGSAGADNILQWVTIENGGSSGWSGAEYSATALLLQGNSLVDIRNSTITGSVSRGITLYEGAEMAFEDNTLSGNEVPAWLHPNTVQYLGSTSTFDGNTDEVVRVGFGNTDRVSTAQTWASPGVPFEVQDRTFIEAPLTLEPGVMLESLAGVSLIVRNGGTLTAEGTDTDPIVFRGSEPLRGSWKGLQIETQSLDNVFDYVLFENGGSDPWTGGVESRAMIYLGADSKAVFTNSTFRGSAYYALWVPAGGDISGFSGNGFENNVRPMIVHPNRAGDVSDDTYFLDNDEELVRVTFGNTDRVEALQTWSAIEVPWRVMDRTFVEAPLTIAVGAQVEFAQNAHLIVRNTGTLTAIGTVDAPISFRGAESLAGYWKGIEIDTGSASNQFQYVSFSDGGSEGWFGGSNSIGTLYITADGVATLDNVEFSNTGGYAGIVASGGGLSCTNTDDGGFQYYVYSPGGNGAQPNCPG